MCFTEGMTTDTTLTPFDKLWDAAMSQRGWFNVETHKFQGLVTGTLNLLSVQYTAGLGYVATVHEAGSSFWASRGERGYAPAQLHTLLLDGDQQNLGKATFVKYVLLATSPIGKYNSADDRSTRHDVVVASVRKVHG